MKFLKKVVKAIKKAWKDSTPSGIKKEAKRSRRATATTGSKATTRGSKATLRSARSMVRKKG